MLIDGLIVYLLHRWDTQRKAAEQLAGLAEHKDDKERELHKKSTRAEKAALRNQSQAQQKGHQAKGNSAAAFVPKHHINQPDKSKKQH